MRVLHVSPYFAPAFVYGGPPRSVLGLCQGLQAHGVVVDVMTTTAAGESELPAVIDAPCLYEGVPVRYFPLAEPRRFWNAPGLRRALSREIGSYDLVHIHGLWHLPGWSAARFARRAGVPYVVSPRGMLEREAMAIRAGRKAVAYRMIERRNLQSAAFLHATSRREAETVEGMGLGRPILFSPNAVNVDALMSTDPTLTLRRFGVRSRFVLFLGRIHPIKRLDLLAAAMRQLRARDVAVVVAGPDENGHQAVLAPLFASAGAQVTWTGAVSGRAKADLLAAASALVLCSDSESFGLSVAEAMAAGTPVVVTKTCPWPEIEREGAGRWVAADPTAIAAALDDILADAARARAMGERGRALVERDYTWPATARILVDAYRSAIDQQELVARAG